MDEIIIDDQFRRKVLESFFENGRLIKIPSKRKKRLVVLEEILKGFEESREYTEKEVNLIIGEIHGDFCTLRRELVDEGYLSRDRGIYKKI